jgi:hypothetical protein
MSSNNLKIVSNARRKALLARSLSGHWFRLIPMSPVN